jgi:hypothetical protein
MIEENYTLIEFNLGILSNKNHQQMRWVMSVNNEI